MMSNEIIFKRNLRSIGLSLGTTFPPELLDFINAKKGSELSMTARTGKKGKGICLWVEDQDEKLSE